MKTPYVCAIRDSSTSRHSPATDDTNAYGSPAPLADRLRGPALVQPLENQLGVRKGVGNGALRRRAWPASGLVQFSFRAAIVAAKCSPKVNYDSARMASVTEAYAGRSLSKPATSMTALACCVSAASANFCPCPLR